MHSFITTWAILLDPLVRLFRLAVMESFYRQHSILVPWYQARHSEKRKTSSDILIRKRQRISHPASQLVYLFSNKEGISKFLSSLLEFQTAMIDQRASDFIECQRRKCLQRGPKLSEAVPMADLAAKACG